MNFPRRLFPVLFLCAFSITARAVSPPVIGGVPNQVIVLNANTGTLYFEIGDPASATLTVAATSGNTALVPGDAAHLTLGGATAQRTIKVTPNTGLTGTAAVTITVTNASSLTASTTFNVTVTAPNTPPTLTGLPGYQIVSPGQAPPALNFTVGDAETGAASLNVTATSSNTNLVPIANITLGGSGANRTVQITPVAGRAGAAMIKLNVTDAAGASAQGEFIFSVFQPASANNALKNGRTAGAIHRPLPRRWKASSSRSWKRTRSSRQRRCWIVSSNNSSRTRSERVPRTTAA